MVWPFKRTDLAAVSWPDAAFEYWYALRRQSEVQREFIFTKEMARLNGRVYARGLDGIPKEDARRLLCWVGWDYEDYYRVRDETLLESPLLP